MKSIALFVFGLLVSLMPLSEANAQSTAWIESFGPSNGVSGVVEVCKTYTGADTLVVQYIHARGSSLDTRVVVAIDGPQNRRAVQTFLFLENSTSGARVLNENIRMYATNGSEICVSVQGIYPADLQTDVVSPVRLTGTIDTNISPPADQEAVNP